MIQYCKAYKLEEVRKFNGWSELSHDDGRDASDDNLVFVWEDLTVTQSCFEQEDYLLETVTPQWEAFCKHDLQFAVPGDVKLAQETVYDMPDDTSDAPC